MNKIKNLMNKNKPLLKALSTSEINNRYYKISPVR